ncbi:MAG: hypothetical protein GY724_29840 [Actinomycetia bacterium]|nr:hypothetical protein [Actinomycetes bacterium]
MTPLGLTSASTLVLLDFDSPYLQSVAWREAVTPVGLDDQAELVETMKLHFERAVSSSISRSESLELIARHARDLE